MASFVGIALIFSAANPNNKSVVIYMPHTLLVHIQLSLATWRSFWCSKESDDAYRSKVESRCLENFLKINLYTQIYTDET